MAKHYKHWLEDTINHIDKHSLMMAHDTYSGGWVVKLIARPLAMAAL
jgi:hypothetical protein